MSRISRFLWYISQLRNILFLSRSANVVACKVPKPGPGASSSKGDRVLNFHNWIYPSLGVLFSERAGIPSAFEPGRAHIARHSHTCPISFQHTFQHNFLSYRLESRSPGANEFPQLLFEAETRHHDFQAPSTMGNSTFIRLTKETFRICFPPRSSIKVPFWLVIKAGKFRLDLFARSMTLEWRFSSLAAKAFPSFFRADATAGKGGAESPPSPSTRVCFFGRAETCNRYFSLISRRLCFVFARELG